MGLLSEGTPLSWEETKKYADYVREHGIKQFINQYHKLKDRSKDSLLWGDEVEYMVVAFDKENKTARLSLRAQDILSALTHDDTTKSEGERHWTWHPEYAAYMVEATPGKPYGSLLQHLNLVEASMRHRRQEVQKKCRPNDKLLTLTAFPRLGCPNFSDPPLKPTPGEGVTHSLFIPDDTIFAGHPRFKNLTRNIRQRRGEKVAINIPIFKDTNTKQPFVEDLAALGDKGESARAALPDHIYMDAMAFGMGCCCLQMTFQACSIDEARMLYDQLTPLTPIILALSAASPIQRGYLSDVDCRWNVIAASVDDRTREERGLEPLRNDRFVIPKSRYDSIDSYLSSHCGGEHNNDMPLVMDHALYQQLIDGGVDHLLSQHIAHLFIRDPVSLFSEKINQDDERDTDHFENIQSTNWQTMRFKPPPAGSSIGWRVEFRPMEVQLTDFENAAFVVFIVLITRIILSFQLNLVIPVSKVDENMKRAQRRDAVRTQTFFFKKDLLTCNTPRNAKNFCGDACADDSDDYSEMTVNEIINGKPGEFSGIIPLIQHYLEGIPDRDVDTMCTLTQYLSLIKKRASGELKTMARWTRDFVLRHPDYRHDSVVSERITYDLVSTCADITDGKLSCPELLMKHSTKTSDALSQATLLAESTIQDRAARRLQQPDGAVVDG